MRRRAGVTLLELMVAMSIFTVVICMLWTILFSLQSTIALEEAQIVTQDDTRGAMLMLVRELRQAVGSSVAVDKAPSRSLRYRIVGDTDGNGCVIDGKGLPEIGGVRTVALDIDDLNKDGRTTTQLVRTEEGSGNVFVLANELDPAGGVTFEVLVDNAVRITLTSSVKPGRMQRTFGTTLSQTVTPRN